MSELNFIMGLFWKKYTIEFSLETKDHKMFRHVYVDFEQKRNWYWLISENMALHRCVLNHIKAWFKLNVYLNYMFEGENPHRLIDESKLEIINKKLNMLWKMNWQPNLSGKIRNIKITHLIL